MVPRFAQRAWVGAAFAFALSAMVVGACGGDETKPPPPQGPPPPQQQPQAGQPAAADAGAADGSADGGVAVAANLPPLPKRDFVEADFSESDRSRDPFRPFSNIFLQQARAHVSTQRNVQAERYALEELRLLGIVTRAPARALLADPTGLGWVAKAGDFIGKAELVHAGGPAGVDVAINWRVDRIRPDDVVFIREDASHPEIPPTTRVLTLHPLEENALGKGR